MANATKSHSLFFDFDVEIKKINDDSEKATDDLIARDHVFFKKSLFRAFLGYNKSDTDNMTMQEYIDSSIVLLKVLKIWHAPFLNHDEK